MPTPPQAHGLSWADRVEKLRSAFFIVPQDAAELLLNLDAWTLGSKACKGTAGAWASQRQGHNQGQRLELGVIVVFSQRENRDFCINAMFVVTKKCITN